MSRTGQQICRRCLRLSVSGRTNTLRHSPLLPNTSAFQWRRSQSTAAEKPYLPRIVQPSLWQSMVPKSLKERWHNQPAKKSNPASYFIWILIFIGSQAIRILTVKKERQQENRVLDQKLRQLREVIERLENGEDVDVEKMLGAGNEAAELEWEQALRELEDEERLWQQNRSSRRRQEEAATIKESDADPVDQSVAEAVTSEPTKSSSPITNAPGFY